MAYSKQSSTSFADFLSRLAAFATLNGWTETVAPASSYGSARILSKRGAHVFIGGYSYNETNFYSNPVGVRQTKTIHNFHMGLGSSADASAAQPKDLPGAPANDIVWPQGLSQCVYSSVWFFSDASGDNIFVVTEQDGERYHHFGFGFLDNNGMSHAEIPYCSASYHYDYHWSGGATSGANHIGTGRKFGCGTVGANAADYGGAGGQMHLRLADVVPLGRGYPEGDVIVGSERLLCTWNADSFRKTDTPHYDDRSQRWGPFDMGWHSGAMPVGQATPLTGLPVFVVSSANRFVYVGDVPLFRLCNVRHVESAAEFSYASDDYVAFPLFRKTDDVHYRAAYEYTSGSAGIAVQKVV